MLEVYSIGFSELEGRGLYAKKHIYDGELICVCPIICFSEEETKIIKKTKLKHYIFDYKNGTEGGLSCISLGDGSLFNHSDYSNVHWRQGFGETLEFFASKTISRGDQLYINYGYTPELINPRKFSIT